VFAVTSYSLAACRPITTTKEVVYSSQSVGLSTSEQGYSKVVDEFHEIFGRVSLGTRNNRLDFGVTQARS